MSEHVNRRAFLRSTVAVAAGAALVEPGDLARAADRATDAKPKLRKALKFGMIGEGSTLREKFELIKSVGFEGVEMDSPGGVNREEAKRAAAETGIVIHGVIDSVHWQKRLSDPAEAVRAEGLAALREAIKDAAFYGATTVLLVPGAVRDPQNENFEQAWSRSQAEIRKALPEAKESNVKIAIEVVWNDFITEPEQLVKYVDEFNDPAVAAYFDISNMIKYGVASADWIRALGPRMVKFDFKGFSKAKQWVKIGEGDENWPEVLKALAEVKYDGWATSEVETGGREHLKDVSQRMDKVLGLG